MLPVIDRLTLLLTLLCVVSATYAQSPPGRERYVPADQLDTIFERSPRGVMLPRAEFQELLQKAQAADQQENNIPESVVVRSARYNVQQNDTHAIVNLTLDIEQFADRWVTVNIPIGNLQVEDASIGGTPAAVGHDPQRPELLLLAHRNAGRFTLELKLSTPLGTVGSDRVAAFRLLSDVSSHMTVVCPENRHLEVNDLKLKRPAPLDQTADYMVPLGTDEVRLKWTSRQQQTETQTLVFARTDAQVQLSQDNLRWSSSTRVSVYGNSVNQLTARVPVRMEITAVDSTGLESWKLEQDPEHTGYTRVILNYRQPFTEDRLVRLSAVSNLETEGNSQVPTVQWIDVTSHTGRLYVNHEDRLRLLATAEGGIRQLSPDERSEAASGGETFDFWMQEYKLTVAVKPRDRELFAQVNSALTIADTLATFTCQTTVEALNAPLFELALQLPTDWQIDAVAGTDQTPVTWRTAGDNNQIVIEPANLVAAGGLLDFQVTMTRAIPDPAQSQVLDLPVITAEDALIVGGTYRISATSDLTIAPLDISGMSPIRDDAGTLLFETQGVTYSGKVSVLRRPVRLASRSVLRSWMDTRQKTVEAIVTVDVLNGTTRSLQLTLPEELGTDVRFSVLSIQPVPGVTGQQIPARIALIEQTPGAVADGQRTFDLTFDQRFVGAITLRTIVQQPRQEVAGAATDTATGVDPVSENSAESLTAPFVKVAGAVRQHGLIVFEAWPEQQLAPVADSLSKSGLTQADASLVDPPPPQSGRRTALVYRFVQPDYRLALQETRFRTEMVPSAVCESIANVSVLSENGMIQRSCVVQLRCIGVQTLRFALPADGIPGAHTSASDVAAETATGDSADSSAKSASLWSTILNDEAVEVRRDGNEYLVAIPSGSDRTSHVLEVLFESNLDDTSVLGRTTQQSLRLAIDTDRDQAAPIDIMEQTWEIRYPATAMLVHHDGGFHPLRDLEQPGWLQSASALFYLPTWNDAGGRLLAAAVMLLALFVVTALIVRRRWKSLLGICVLGFLLSLLALPATQQAREAARRVVGAQKSSLDAAASTEGAAEPLWGGTDVNTAVDDMEVAATVTMPEAMEEMNRLQRDAATVAEPRSATSGGDLPRFSQPPSFGGQQGGFGAGGYGGATKPGMGIDMGMGGMEGTNAAGRNTDGAMAQTDPGQAGQQPDSPGFGSPQPAPPTDESEPTDATAEDPFGETEALGLAAKRTGVARLSIRAAVAQPEDYNSMQFRSIGATPAAGTLRVVVQERSRLNAVRIMAASIVVLLCLWFNKATTAVGPRAEHAPEVPRGGSRKKLVLAVLLLLGSAAAVALVPNQWQTAVDGVLLGTLIGIAIWVVCGTLTWIVSIWRSMRESNCCDWFRRETVTTALLLLAASLPTCPVAAGPQDDDAPNTKPDVVLPYAPGRPELSPERVFVPHDEFLKLYKAAHPGVLQPDAAVTDAAVVAAFYESRALTQVKDTDHSQSFAARYVIRNFADAPAQVRLPIGAVAVRSAKLNGNAALLSSLMVRESASPEPKQIQQAPQQNAAPQAKTELLHSEQPGYIVRIPEKGLHVLEVVFEVPATVENSVGRFTVPLQPVPAGTMTFELPAEKLDARVNGRSNAFRSDGTTLVIPIAAATGTRIEWRPEANVTSSDTIYHAVVNSALVMNDAGLNFQSSVKINVRQGQLAEVDLTLPNGYAIQKVDSADIAGWNLLDDNAQQLKVLFRQPIDGETSLQLTMFRQQTFSTKENTVDVPVPTVVGASRDSGNVTVLAGRELEVRVQSLSGVSQLNAAEATLPEGLEEDLRRVLAWRYTRHPATIAVRVFRTADRLEVTTLNGVQLETQRQLWTTLVSAQISGAPRRRLEIQVPQDFLALNVTANDLADWYFTGDNVDAAHKLLNIQFSTAKVGPVSAVIQGQTGRTASATEARLVAPVVPESNENMTHVSIWLDAASEISSSTADGWKRTGSEAQIDPRLLKLKSLAPDISFISTQHDLQPIALNLRQAPASLMAESVSVTNVTDTSVELTLGLHWKISRAATRELSLRLPTEVANVFDFKVPGLRLLQKDSVADMTQITLHLQQPVSEQFFVLGTGTLPLPENLQVAAQPPEFVATESSQATIAAQSHYWVVVNQSAGLLQAIDPDANGEDVSPDEITTRIPNGFLQQSVAIRRLKTDRPTSAWQLKFPPRQQVAPAVIALAAHTTILAVDGTWRSRHLLQVRNESRQFLPVVLPDESRILYCLVKGQPTRVVSRDEGEQLLHLIPVPQSGEVSAPFEVQFAISGRLPAVGKELLAHELQIPVPTFPQYRDFPEYGITVSRNTWSVFVPEEWQASLIEDPRQSNVISADADDFQDAVLLTAADNVKTMLNVLSLSSSPYGESSGGEVWFEIEKQKRLLGRQRGKSEIAENEREETLKQLQEAERMLGEQLQQQQRGTRQNRGQQQGGSSLFFDSSVLGSGSSAGTNRYLDTVDQITNDFNYDNNLSLFNSNSARGLQESKDPQSAVSTFNFVLPEITKSEKASGVDRAEPPADAKKKGQAGRPAAGKPVAQELQNRSKLLERRESNVKEQADKAKDDAAQRPQIRMVPQQNAAPAIDPFNGTIDGVEGQELTIQTPQEFGVQANQPLDELFEAPTEGEPVSAQGLLSLDFLIPQDGVRHDFMRPSGNAQLTLKVRSSEMMHSVYGWLWAGACLIAALLLLRGRSGGSLLLRLLVLVAILGLTGWLCLPGALRILALLCCLSAAVAVSLTVIATSLRRGASA